VYPKICCFRSRQYSYRQQIKSNTFITSNLRGPLPFGAPHFLKWIFQRKKNWQKIQREATCFSRKMTFSRFTNTANKTSNLRSTLIFGSEIYKKCGSYIRSNMKFYLSHYHQNARDEIQGVS